MRRFDLPGRKRNARWVLSMPETLPAGMVQERAPVVAHRRIARDHYLLRLESGRAARRAKPGQFVHVLCEGEARGQSPLLRRPLSLFDADPRRGTIDFIYKVVGLGTEVLAQIRPGAKVDFIGPLGHPFDLATDAKQIYLMGGGVGIPPLYLLAKSIPKGRSIEVFLGARTKNWVICAADFRKLGLPVHIATDDGTRGYRGSVVDLLAKQPVMLSLSKDERGPILYLCGPTPMMAAAARLARELGIPAQVSLEERMGCAMGVCMGCVVEVNSQPAGTHARFQRVCTEGPVFPAEEVLWR